MTINPSESPIPMAEPSRLEKARAELARIGGRVRHGRREMARTTIGILKAQQEATLDGILVVDSTGQGPLLQPPLPRDLGHPR